MLEQIRENGEILNERYIVKDIIGRGGSSNVYYAIHIALDMPVAIKEVSAEKLGKVSAANEALVLKEIKHPALPVIMDIFEEGSYTYIVREYCKGVDVRKRVDEQGPFSLKESEGIARNLASALSFMHSQNPALIYRDLKPSNVIIDENNDLKLIDFGISRKFDENKSDDTQYIGSRKYAAPEQFGLGQSTTRTDIYALGMFLYFIYTGDDYCDLEEEEKWLKFRNYEELKLKKAILKAISFRPDDRQESVDELIEEAFEDDKYRFENAKTEKLPNSDDKLIGVKNEDYDHNVGARPRAQIAFYGLKSSVGVSHIALLSALAAAKKGFNTILCERGTLGGYDKYGNFINGEDVNESSDETEIRLGKLRLILQGSNKNLADLISEDYDLLILDFGSSQRAMGDFLRSQNKYFVLPSSPFALNQNLSRINEMKKYKDMNFIFNLAGKKTSALIKWLGLEKRKCIKLGYIDTELQDDSSDNLLLKIGLERYKTKKKSILGRLAK